MAHVLDEQEVPQVLEEIGDEPAEVLPLLGELLDERQHAGRVAVDDHVADAEQRLLLDGTDELEHRLRVDRAVRRGGELVEGRHGVPERPAGAAGDQRQGRVGRLDSLAFRDPAQQRDELGEPGSLEDERLAARADGGEHLAELGRAEDEEEMRRWLLDELEECVPGRGRQLVRLVEDVHLVPALDRLQHHALADLPDVVDAALRGGVHLDDVEGRAVRDGDARVARLVRAR